MEEARRGDWVRIHDIILTPEERLNRLPEDTRKVPLEMWVKGALVDESARPGDRVTVETATGRRTSGVLQEIAPAWDHGFGRHIPELEELGRRLRRTLKELMAEDEA